MTSEQFSIFIAGFVLPVGPLLFFIAVRSQEKYHHCKKNGVCVMGKVVGYQRYFKYPPAAVISFKIKKDSFRLPAMQRIYFKPSLGSKIEIFYSAKYPEFVVLKGYSQIGWNIILMLLASFVTVLMLYGFFSTGFISGLLSLISGGISVAILCAFYRKHIRSGG